MVTLVGATSHISIPGLAAKVAGNPAHEFTIIQSFDILVGGIVNGKTAWSFTGTSSTAKLIEANVAFTSHFWQTNQFDDAAHANASTSTFGQCTLTKFTIGALDGATLINVMPMNWRGTVFSPFAMVRKYIDPVVSYFMNE